MRKKEPTESGCDNQSADDRRWQSGATAIEYGLIAAFVALAIFSGTMVAGNGLGSVFLILGDLLQNAFPS